MRIIFVFLVLLLSKCNPNNGKSRASENIADSKEKKVFIEAYKLIATDSALWSNEFYQINEVWAENHWLYGDPIIIMDSVVRVYFDIDYHNKAPDEWLTEYLTVKVIRNNQLLEIPNGASNDLFFVSLGLNNQPDSLLLSFDSLSVVNDLLFVRESLLD